MSMESWSTKSRRRKPPDVFTHLLTRPHPGPEQAKQVEDFVRQWVEERVGDGNIYSIPPRAGQEVAGTLAGFHTVHQKDADTYSVCVDFQDGDNTYDVDFVVSRADEGLTLDEHYLHMVNGEAVE